MCNLVQLFARAKLFNSMDNNQTREALRIAIIPATACDAFAARLQNPDAARAATLASMLPNRDRLPALADALRTESAKPLSKVPSKPVRQPARILRLATKRDACDVLKRATRAFPIHLRVRELYDALATVAQVYGLPMKQPRLRKATTACPFAVHDACIDFAYAPTAENLAKSLSSLMRYDLTVLAQHDAQPARLMTPGVKAPEPNAPQVHRIPGGALDWVTNGAPKEPEHYALKRETSRISAAHDERAYAVHTARNAKPPAKRLSKKAPQWKARMGKEVLRLKK